MNHESSKKLNNKGFSLVELIIVVAIMAVLVGVLAPQYLRYVERSKESRDLSSIETLVSAVTIYSADPANRVVEGAMECAADGTITSDEQAVRDALTQAGINDFPVMQSEAYSNWEIVFTREGLIFRGPHGTALEAALGHVPAAGTPDTPDTPDTP